MEQLTERRQQINESDDPKVNTTRSLAELIKELIAERITECNAAKPTLTEEEYDARMAKLKEYYARLADYVEATRVHSKLTMDALNVMKARSGELP